MRNIKLYRREIIRHSIVWLIITAFITFIDPPEGTLLGKVIITILLMFNLMIVYYIESIFIFPKYFKKNVSMLLLHLLVTLIIYELIEHFTFFIVCPIFEYEESFDNGPAYTLLLNSIFLFFIVSIVAFGGFQNNVSKSNINMQNAKDKIMLIKELGFFKNQFNPHIVFNFLNYCYSHIRTESKDGAEAIIRFSEMLRYTFDNNPDEPVSLQKEITYITNFINLQKQLHKKTQVSFQIAGELTNMYILPRVLINFVENAFKHGDTHSISCPIKIRIEAYNNAIKLFVSNKKKSSQKAIISTGIGNLNVISQLELAYKNNYEYSYTDENEIYSCKLFLINKPIIS